MLTAGVLRCFSRSIGFGPTECRSFPLPGPARSCPGFVKRPGRLEQKFAEWAAHPANGRGGENYLELSSGHPALSPGWWSPRGGAMFSDALIPGLLTPCRVLALFMG